MNNNAAILWTGGKDCALAFLKAQQAGYNITLLVTFTPKNPDFKAHPIFLIEKQVEVIGVPHQFITVENPIKKSYENAISTLKSKHQINTLITGDIDEVDGHSNWIEQCSKKSGMRVFNPLWKKERALLLRDLINNNFTLLFSLVKKEYFTKNWIGKPLNETTITELQKLNIDICGENGEYHTMVTNTPFFKQKVNINTSNIQENEHFYFLNNNRLDIL